MPFDAQFHFELRIVCLCSVGQASTTTPDFVPCAVLGSSATPMPAAARRVHLVNTAPRLDCRVCYAVGRAARDTVVSPGL